MLHVVDTVRAVYNVQVILLKKYHSCNTCDNFSVRRTKVTRYEPHVSGEEGIREGITIWLNKDKFRRNSWVEFWNCCDKL